MQEHERPSVRLIELLLLPTILSWIVCGEIAGRVFRRSGRGYWRGCLTGALLGPLGILIVLLFDPTPEVRRVQQLNSGDMTFCRLCLGLIPPNARVCRHCDRDVPAYAAH